jgi:hypothetical protein
LHAAPDDVVVAGVVAIAVIGEVHADAVAKKWSSPQPWMLPES